MDCKSRILFFLICACFLHLTSSSKLRGNTLWQGEELNFGDRLVSDLGELSLSFFKPSNYNNNNLYLGVNSLLFGYYFWVANRDTPIPADSGAALTIDEYGNLKIMYNGGGDSIVLYSSVEAPKNTSLFLPDTGNVELREMNPDGSIKQDVLWQASDCPTDTLFKGTKLGINKRTGQTRSLTSRRSFNNPSSGPFTLGMDPNNTKQLVIWWWKKIVWTSGEWDHNERTFSNTKGLVDFNFTYVSNENETYFKYFLISYLNIVREGVLFGGSGAYYSCVSNNHPPFQAGCKLPKPPSCRSLSQQHNNSNDLILPSWNGTGKMSMEGFRFDESENLTTTDCWLKCLNNCSCVAYSNTNEDATGCEIWGTKAKFAANNDGRQIYFLPGKLKAKSRRRLIVRSLAGGAIAIFISCSICFVFWRKHKAKVNMKMKQLKLLLEIGGNATLPTTYDATKVKNGNNKLDGKTNQEIHIFSFGSIATATNNFSSANKLGEGGYGPVYKGKLTDGQEIAIKRLSQSSGQGLEEFKNEAQLIAKLQHRNLVRILGFCIEREERILVYEYMSNKSLDFYLFGIDSNKKKLSNWKRRFRIIEGIVQGFVYLHNYSRLTVIHRDLKASNILLDDEMNPKISDFGMARIFKSKESVEKTRRVVGTFGYMSPEYVTSGVISIKIDIFSYGVLLLEIVSGKRNNSCYQIDGKLNLIAYAWQLWTDDKVIELIDPTLDSTIKCSPGEVLRCIHIGLLCVQDKATDRPTMLDIVSFLSNETIQLAQPKPPAFLNNIVVMEQQHDLPINHGSLNDVTISEMGGR
ncbi:putative Receptor protein kinase [Quillaja saponaria]|uniref:Receptor-like serine/threonine-protein kinase n=1 Tax=Quillaja saponaria TaxID=32244 RepID=A0AAD7L568_QUISA|nr:putative Receptor protein kinase [Quillaja saponaria]